MELSDDDLTKFYAEGPPALPVGTDQGHVYHDGARIWYSTFGAGWPVILLHGGLGHGGNWGYQVPAVVGSGYRVVLLDSRGHGRSTRDARPFSYELMASDVLAVMDELHLARAAIVGWSDGACTGLVLAKQAPERIAGVFFFGCNMDPSGTKPFEASLALDRCFARHRKDYIDQSSTPGEFDAFVEAVGLMQRTQPNYTADDLAEIQVPVTLAQSERDEFIKREHANYLARSIPRASFVLLRGVTHFAPLQRPEQFNRAVLAFLGEVCRKVAE
jgi:pimeloyl-ACP methyl ester carboxylesterase